MLNNISGFPEFSPNDQMIFNDAIQLIKNKFELYGFSPLDTVAVEKTTTLLSKGNDNEIYGIYRLAGDEGSNKKDLALRFDLTVPLARYVSQNYNILTFPYRRYQIAPVWRGERSQSGRYRQFYQCDIDIINEQQLSLTNDAELVAIVVDILKSLHLKDFIVKINNRKILMGLLKSLSVEIGLIPSVIRIIDKIAKITTDAFIAELLTLGVNQDIAQKLLLILSQRMSNDNWITYLESLSDEEEFVAGLVELKEILFYIKAFKVDDVNIQIDLSLARGLNYYTGTIYEVISLEYPEIGSIAGGGRYANLVSSFSNKTLPGVGISIGISRLIPKMIEAGVWKSVGRQTAAQLLITVQNLEMMEQYLLLVQFLRNAGIKTEIYLENKPLSSQMKYASKKGFAFVIIANEEELNSNQLILRNMHNSEQLTMPLDSIPAFLQNK
jgi:histidyl-tRNA synthetase